MAGRRYQTTTKTYLLRVGALHQNGKAEKRIRDMQDLARTSLLHANNEWPGVIDSRLWPYALRHANEAINTTFFPGQSKSPIELFSGVEASPDHNNRHTFGCPVFALDGKPTDITENDIEPYYRYLVFQFFLIYYQA